MSSVGSAVALDKIDYYKARLVEEINIFNIALKEGKAADRGHFFGTSIVQALVIPIELVVRIFLAVKNIFKIPFIFFSKSQNKLKLLAYRFIHLLLLDPLSILNKCFSSALRILSAAVGILFPKLGAKGFILANKIEIWDYELQSRVRHKLINDTFTDTTSSKLLLSPDGPPRIVLSENIFNILDSKYKDEWSLKRQEARCESYERSFVANIHSSLTCYEEFLDQSMNLGIKFPLAVKNEFSILIKELNYENYKSNKSEFEKNRKQISKFIESHDEIFKKCFDADSLKNFNPAEKEQLDQITKKIKDSSEFFNYYLVMLTKFSASIQNKKIETEAELESYRKKYYNARIEFIQDLNVLKNKVTSNVDILDSVRPLIVLLDEQRELYGYDHVSVLP